MRLSGGNVSSHASQPGKRIGRIPPTLVI